MLHRDMSDLSHSDWPVGPVVSLSDNLTIWVKVANISSTEFVTCVTLTASLSVLFLELDIVLFLASIDVELFLAQTSSVTLPLYFSSVCVDTSITELTVSLSVLFFELGNVLFLDWHGDPKVEGASGGVRHACAPEAMFRGPGVVRSW